MPGEKIRSKDIRVQVRPLIPSVQYWMAIGSGLACIAVLVILVLVIFAFRRFEVQHDITCRSAIPDVGIDVTDTSINAGVMNVSLNFEMLQTTQDNIETLLPNLKIVLSKVFKIDEKFIQIKLRTPIVMDCDRTNNFVEAKVKAFNELEKEELLSYMNPKTFVEEMNIRISDDPVLLHAGIGILKSDHPTIEELQGTYSI